MPLNELLPRSNPARDDVQQTDLGYDVVSRYICNNWQEIAAAQGPGAYPFDVVVIGAGMFGGYCAEKLYRFGRLNALRILMLDAGAFLLQSHIQNLPQQLGGKVGGPNYLRTRDDATGAQNVVWGMPWISNEAFPGLAYCIGGRSLFWGGWSPPLTDVDLANWPDDVTAYLKSAAGYASTELEIGTATTTDFITHTALFNALLGKIQGAIPLAGITEAGEAPLAVVGTPPRSGLFAFDKFSSAPFIMDAIRNDVAVNSGSGDISRRIFLVPRAQVHRLNLNAAGDAVTSLDVSVAGVRRQLAISKNTAVIIANGTVEGTRLALESLGVGSTQFGSPRVGNLMAHLRSNITVRIKRAALGLSAPVDLETVALIARGSFAGRQFHHQITAADVATPNPEAAMWSMVPDIDIIGALLANEDPNWVTITFRGIGEMEDQRAVNNIDPARSWIDLSAETDQWGMRRAYVNLVATPNDRQLWAAMDQSAFDLALAVAGNPANIEYWNSQSNQWQPTRPQPDASGRGFWQDRLGTTHHEAGTLFMGAPGASITDTSGKFHGKANAYVAGPALFPTLGSANPSLTALSLACRTARTIAATVQAPAAGFAPLSLATVDWQMVKQPGSPASVIHHGLVLETSGWYGLYWYTKEQFSNFILSLEWRISRREENSGIYIRIPAPNIANPLQAADAQGHEIQIDQRGFDSVTGTEGHPLKVTGAIYDLQAPSASTQVQIGVWNKYEIEAVGSRIRVTLNGQLVNDYQSPRQQTGYLALQAHDFLSRTQFRNLMVKKLP